MRSWTSEEKSKSLSEEALGRSAKTPQTLEQVTNKSICYYSQIYGVFSIICNFRILRNYEMFALFLL